MHGPIKVKNYFIRQFATSLCSERFAWRQAAMHMPYSSLLSVLLSTNFISVSI